MWTLVLGQQPHGERDTLLATATQPTGWRPASEISLVALFVVQCQLWS